MKVLMVVTYLNVGGTETHVLSLARSLKKMGHTVGIASKGGPFEEKFKASGICVHRIPKYANIRGMTRTILNIIKVQGYQLIHAHDEESFYVVGMGQRLTRVPCVITVHGRYHSIPSLRRAAVSAKRIITVSPSVYRWVHHIGIKQKKLEVLANGIDTALFAPFENPKHRSLSKRTNRFVVAYVGRFEGQKANVAKKVIAASRLLAYDHPTFQVILHGVGPARPQLIRKANQANQRLGRQCIRFVPTKQLVQTTYHTADLVIGSGRVAMEAMASGKPVIGMGNAGYVGIIDRNNIHTAVDGNFGDHSAPFSSTPKLLARDIKRLLKSPLDTLANWER
ncbi:glycosyltransferase [Alicyclobacillus fastidiosus]|uniref:glycosyltransferase n=1 Tax=Alicyclobacillus fastidiosus TaxID=392011 RepID=UPI0023E9CDDA|nr:glycosyltransferase [Alicyclobacillus fastidiosus]GMA61040.1 hypothetical protein GCM10025859_14800 [Alicyclobacillus fastidiosus]